MVENIRKPIKLNDIFQATAEQLCNILRAKRCTVHMDVEDFFNIEAEWRQPFVQSVSTLPKMEVLYRKHKQDSWFVEGSVY